MAPLSGRPVVILFSLLALLAALASCRAERAGGPDRWQAPDLDANIVHLLAGAPAATVLIFVAHDCPISNRYAPVVERLYDDFASRGVRFFLVYADPRATSSQLQQHVSAYRYSMPPIDDRELTLAGAIGATITPEAAVLDSRGEILYRGRIDNRYTDFGVSRPRATRDDLRLTLEAVLAGVSVPEPRTQAVGCFLVTANEARDDI